MNVRYTQWASGILPRPQSEKHLHHVFIFPITAKCTATFAGPAYQEANHEASPYNKLCTYNNTYVCK